MPRELNSDLDKVMIFSFEFEMVGYRESWSSYGSNGIDTWRVRG